MWHSRSQNLDPKQGLDRAWPNHHGGQVSRMPYKPFESQCQRCGTAFITRHPEQRHCSRSCAARGRPSTCAETTERIVFNGDAYYRYPQSDRPSHRAYFHRPGKSLHVAIWEHHNGPVPDGFEIHHIDHNTLNNDVSNLECVATSAHRRESQAHRKLHTYCCTLCGVEFQAYRASLSPNRFCCVQHKRKYHNNKRSEEIARLRLDGRGDTRVLREQRLSA